MNNDPRPSWVREQDERRAAVAVDLRFRLNEMADGHIFWAVFNSTGGKVERMLARKRDSSIKQLGGKGFSPVPYVDLSWQSMVDSPLADITWREQKNWPRDDGNETMRIEEIDDDLLANLEMLRHHQLRDKFRLVIWAEHVRLGGTVNEYWERRITQQQATQ